MPKLEIYVSRPDIHEFWDWFSERLNIEINVLYVALNVCPL